MDPITIAMGLAQFAPSLIKWITGSDKAADVATKAVDLAKTVTGSPTGDEALSVLKANPELALKYRTAVLEQEVEFEKLAVANASDINKTMQTEAAADHWPTYSWRPFIGFCVGFNTAAASILTLAVFGSSMFGVLTATAAIAQLPLVLGALAGINGTVLPILGIASWYRGKMQADPKVSTDNRG